MLNLVSVIYTMSTVFTETFWGSIQAKESSNKHMSESQSL